MADPIGDCDWDERLQDWIDGEVDPTEAAAITSHAAECARCTVRMQAMLALDGKLSQNLPGPELGKGFDRKVLALISSPSVEPSAPAHTRARLEREWQSQKELLNRAQRRLWTWVAVDLLAAVGLARVAANLWTERSALSWLERLVPASPAPGWTTLLTVAAMSSVVGFAIVQFLRSFERS